MSEFRSKLQQSIVEIPLSSPDYPEAWKGLPDAPPVLYAKGNVRLLQERKLVIVGSRRTPAPALKLGTKLSKELSESLVVVTGTADGGDGAAIEGALHSGNIICLLAGGFSSISQNNYALLEQVAERGLLLSPHAYETPVRSFSYEYRNKLLAALGEGTLVLGAAEKSGALITAKHAKAMQKHIFALPYFPGSSAGAGCNGLLKSGGVLVETALDVLSVMGITHTERKEVVALTADEEKMWQALQDMSEGHIVELSAKAGIPPFKAKAVLSALEVKGKAVALGGNRYAAV